MSRARMSDLSKVTEAAFQKEYQKLNPVLQEEARVMQQLARLNRQLDQVRADSALSDGYRVTGTDVLWHRWESATRRQLNTELARVRSQKLEAMEHLRRAFGRKQAVEALAKQDSIKAKKRRE